MVSSVPAPLRNPSVSYAERAKKAQSIRPPNALRVAPPDTQTSTPRSGSSDAASATRSSAPSSAFPLHIDEPSSGSRPHASSSSGRTVEANSMTTASEPAVTSCSSSSAAQTSPTTSNIIKGPPVVNVWAERIKEQKAQAQAQAQVQGTGKPQSQFRYSASSGSGSSQHHPDATISASQASTSMSIDLVTNAKPGALDLADDHDPFVVRVPPHLSRQSSSNTNPLPVTPASDLNGWPEVGKTRMAVRTDNSRSTASMSESKGYLDDRSPYNSVPPSRKNSNTSSRHHSYSRSGSAQLSRVHSRNHLETLSQASYSASQSRIESRSGSSASSPKLQMRGRRLPEDDMGVADARYDHQRISSHTRMSPGLGEPQSYPPVPYPNGSLPPTSDPTYYRQHPDHYHAQNFVPPHALPPHYPNHIPGHTSPPYLGTSHHSGPGTPPYLQYPPYPPYAFGHPPMFWNDLPPSLLQQPYFPTHPGIPPTHVNTSEPPIPRSAIEFATQEIPHSAITADSRTSNGTAGLESGHQPAPNAEHQPSLPLVPANSSKGVVFGTIDVPEPDDELDSPSSPTRGGGQNGKDVADDVDRTTESFAAFSIGVTPDEPGPSRLANRKTSIKSLSKPQASNLNTPASNGLDTMQNASDATKQSVDPSGVPPQQQLRANGIELQSKWQFGTTDRDTSEDEPRSASSPPPPSQFDPPNFTPTIATESISPAAGDISSSSTQQPIPLDPMAAAFAAPVAARFGPTGAPPVEISRPRPSTQKSEDGSTASDVFEVKDFGYGFGDVSGCANATDIIRWEMEQREKERLIENYREREMIRAELHRERERGWGVQGRQQAWRHENGVEDGKEFREPPVDVPRAPMRPRRGSYPGPYNGHERGGFGGRRARGFGGRYHGGRHLGRGGFQHQHQRPASLPHVPPQFEVVPPAVDLVNGYGQLPHVPTYVPPEYDSYQAMSPNPLNPGPPVSSPSTSALRFILNVTRTHLLGQLEYYLSPQNLAQDFFLRQRMDSEGWIPISLLASFKRVRHLTTDLDLVRDVLSMSSVVEVKGNWVRMAERHWEQFILPNAPMSVVEPIEASGIQPVLEEAGPMVSQDQEAVTEAEGEVEAEECEVDVEDEDEEDIVFVIGEEAEGSWMPERKQA